MNHLLRTLWRLLGVALLAAVVLSVLALAVCAALLSVLWSLLRGRKPAMVSVFQSVRQMSPSFAQARPGALRPGPDDVVDVQAREISSRLPGRNPP